MRVIVLLVSVLLVGGCAGLAEKTKHAVTFKSWDHFAFSTKANWQIFHYWNATATRRDAELAQRQGGWWGDEVPVADK